MIPITVRLSKVFTPKDRVTEEASIVEVCANEDEVATNSASGGAATLHAPVLETPAAARVPA